MADGSQPKRLTNFNAGVANGPRWSPDGRWIAFGATIDKNPDIYVVSADGGPPQPMTRESSAETQPSWSRDGRWIYFMSNRSGEKQIWKIPTRGGEASQVTRNGGFQALESADGYLYYAKRQSGRGLWRVPVNGGAETPVSDVVWHNLWAISDESIYYLDVTNEVPQVFAISRPIAVRRIDLKTQKVTTITTIDAQFPDRCPGGRSQSRRQADGLGEMAGTPFRDHVDPKSPFGLSLVVAGVQIRFRFSSSPVY